MTDQTNSQPGAVLAALKSSTIPKRLDELTQQRIEGQRVSNELVALQRAMGKQAYTTLERIIRSQPSELDALFSELAVTEEDKALFREWNAKYITLQDSFAVARSVIRGSKNSWRDLAVEVEVGESKKPFVHWEISDPEGPVFEMRASLLSTLNLSVYLLRSMVEGTERLVDILDEKSTASYQETLESIHLTLADALDVLRKGRTQG